MISSTSLQLPALPPSLSPTTNSLPGAPKQNGLFGEMLTSAMNNIVNQQSKAEHLIEENLMGHQVTDVEVLTGIKQADLALKTMVQVRNKVVEAYKELKQVQV